MIRRKVLPDEIFLSLSIVFLGADLIFSVL